MFKIYLLNSANYPTEIYNDNNVYDPIAFEPELEMNGDNGVLIGKLTFKLHDPSYSPQLRLLQNTVVVTQMIAGVETVIFRGRPLLRDDDEYNDQDFTFEGILSGLNDTLQAPSNKRGLGFYEHFKTIMDWHNSQVQEYANNRQIDYSKISKTDPASYMCTITETDPVGILWESMLEYTRSRASSMEHIKTQYVDAHGGCFYLENEPLVYDANGCIVLHNYLKYIDIYNPDQAHVNGQRIEFGKNLISIKRSASADDFATVLIPLGKQLTDIEKSWPYYQSTDNNKIRKIVSSPDNAEIVNYAVTGAYINSETGAVVSGIGSAYVIPGDVDVEYGDVFYLTTYLEGISTNMSIAAYAVMSRDGQRVFSVGSTVRNSNDSTGKLALKDERIEIPTPEDDTIQLKLRTAYMISANDPNGGFVLKKFNKNYQEDNVTIMSADPVTTGTVRKIGQFAVGRDVYPDATGTPTAPETYEESKRLVNQDLFAIFGPIEKSIELPDYGTDKIKDLVYWGSLNLERMGEDLEIEIQAADLSYIDESQEPFQPFDLVPVESSPHNLDMMLPIVKMTLPLADPAAAMYTLQNDIHLSEDSKKYISQMVSSPGSTGQKNQTVVIYGGRGGSGGGGSAVGAVLYNMPQNLNEAQKAQARSNIGVGSGGDVEVHFPYITPEDYGAVGDGATDDTDAVQHALAESITSGKTLFLERKYLVTETLLPNSYYSQTSATVNIIGASPMKRDEFDASKLGGGTILFEHGENGLHLFDGSDGGLTLRGTIHGVKFAPTARAQKSAIFYRCILRGFVFESCFVLNVLAFLHNSSCRAITKIQNSTFLTCYFFSKEDSDTAHDFTDSTIEGCYINGGSEMTDNHCFEWNYFNGSTVTNNFIDFYRTIYAPQAPTKSAFQGPISANNQYQVFRYFYDVSRCTTFQIQSDSDCFNWTAPSTLEKLQGYTPLTYTGHDEQTHEMPPYILGVFETGKVEINNAIFQSNIGNIVFVRNSLTNYDYAKAKLSCNINSSFFTHDTYVKLADSVYGNGSYKLNLIDVPFIKNVDALPSIGYAWSSATYPGMRVRYGGHIYRYRWVRNGSVWVAKWVDEVPESADGFVHFVTPEQFGAVGDGVTDDTVAIQAAFDAAANGGTVKFGHKKTYLVTKDNGGTAYTTGNTHPVILHYMLRIHGSITILGNGSTIKEPEITQAVYDAEYPIRYNTEIRNSASMIWLDNSERRSSAAADNSAEINDRNYVIIRGLVLDGSCHVERNLDHGGGAGAWWKAIYANDTRATYLELNSVTIRDFAAEGVYAQVSNGSKFRAFGCTFENCTPSAWNCGGSLAEAIGCTFNCTDPTNHASEYVSQKTIFDSCSFYSETMRPLLMQGKAGTELIVRNSVFNTSSTAKPIPTIYTVYYDEGFTAEKYWQSGTVYLFARSSGNTFALATELQDGQDFLITNVDSGSGYALAKNTDGSLKSVAVTVSSGSVTLSDTSAVWVCSTNTNGFVLKNHEQTVIPSDSEDEGGDHQGDVVDAYLTCNATYGLLTSASFASTRWWSYSDENQLKLRITPPQYLSTIYTRDSQNVFVDSCVFNNQRATENEEAIVSTKSWQYGKINNCTFNRATMSADSVFYPVFVGQAQNNIVRVTNYPTYPDGASIIGRGLSIRLTGRSKYKFNMISAPRTFTIAPSENCTLVAWGFGNRVINVNVPVYAHARAQFNVDYSSLPSAPYYNEYFSAMRNFFVECDKPFNIIIET